MERLDIPSWDEYYMVEAFWSASRSPDIRTKHGAVIVAWDYSPISQGYNAYPRKSWDEKMPKDAPGKYLVTIHAEDNAILFAKQDLKGTRLYVTGMPCARCWTKIIQKGIKRVMYGPVQSKCNDEDDTKAREALLSSHPEIELLKYPGDVYSIASLLQGRASDILRSAGLL